MRDLHLEISIPSGAMRVLFDDNWLQIYNFLVIYRSLKQICPYMAIIYVANYIFKKITDFACCRITYLNEIPFVVGWPSTTGFCSTMQVVVVAELLQRSCNDDRSHVEVTFSRGSNSKCNKCALVLACYVGDFVGSTIGSDFELAKITS